MSVVPPDWFAQTDDGGTGCYVHLPFCDRICPYCDFAVVRLRHAQVPRYLRALHDEIEAPYDDGPERIQTLYFGGGTPSALASGDLEWLAATIFARFRTAAGSIEFTLEANPSRGIEAFSRYRRMGVNRLSVGVQSFHDDELRRLGRDHDAAGAVVFVRAARAAGFDNLSLDLMAGVPGQTLQSFGRSLRRALELGVDHISVYGLTIEAGTPYAAWNAREPQAFADDDAQASMLALADDLLTEAGMQHYEISNFTRPGFACAHNIGYWRQRDCRAFGLSAAGYENGLRYANVRDLHAYCDAMEQRRTPRAFEERLPAAARVGEAAMLALRTSHGLRVLEFERRFGIDARSAFLAAIEKSKAAGLLEEAGGAIRLSRKGRLLANEACALFLDPELSIAR